MIDLNKVPGVESLLHQCEGVAVHSLDSPEQCTFVARFKYKGKYYCKNHLKSIILKEKQ